MEKSSGKRKKGRFRVGSHHCVHTGLLGTETLSLFKLGKHDERGLIRWLVCRCWTCNRACPGVFVLGPCDPSSIRCCCCCCGHQPRLLILSEFLNANELCCAWQTDAFSRCARRWMTGWEAAIAQPHSQPAASGSAFHFPSDYFKIRKLNLGIQGYTAGSTARHTSELFCLLCVAFLWFQLLPSNMNISANPARLNIYSRSSRRSRVSSISFHYREMQLSNKT